MIGHRSSFPFNPVMSSHRRTVKSWRRCKEELTDSHMEKKNNIGGTNPILSHWMNSVGIPYRRGDYFWPVVRCIKL